MVKLIQGTIGASIGAILGALIWYGIIYFTEYEIGIVAWGIGALVGFGAAVCGGEGLLMGGISALLALLSISLGKFLYIYLIYFYCI